MTGAADDDLTARAARELANHGPLELVLRPESVLTLAGLMQLVLRHPGIRDDDNAGSFATMLIEHARGYFATCPAALDILRRGDDPANDR